MKIAATDLALQSSRSAAVRREESETLRSWRGERPDFEAEESAVGRFSAAARQLLAAAATHGTDSAGTAAASGAARTSDAGEDALGNDPFLAMICQMIEFLTGEKVKVFDLRDFSGELRQVDLRSSAVAQERQTADWGMEYDYHAVREEFEQTAFSANGTIRTADGEEFSFSFDLEMTRYYREETHQSVRAGNAVRKDPLVVNFGGTAAQLANFGGQRFAFDLDGDGKAEALPVFASGSGYLALDRNGNGKIDSGKELFGPASGHGFAELAQYDEDGNGWIDAGDAIFERLSVWTPAATGNGTQRSLADLGIGALGLANVASPFALRGSNNEDLGVVKASGIYLGADGRAGSLQEIDLTV